MGAGTVDPDTVGALVRDLLDPGDRRFARLREAERLGHDGA